MVKTGPVIDDCVLVYRKTLKFLNVKFDSVKFNLNRRKFLLYELLMVVIGLVAVVLNGNRRKSNNK